MAGFFWYELMTTDVEGAKCFYGDVVGWTPRDFQGGDYTILNAGEHGAGGLMAPRRACPPSGSATSTPPTSTPPASG